VRDPEAIITPTVPFAIRSTPKMRNTTIVTAALCMPSQPFNESSSALA
jgi:hypothetical protein